MTKEEQRLRRHLAHVMRLLDDAVGEVGHQDSLEWLEPRVERADARTAELLGKSYKRIYGGTPEYVPSGLVGYQEGQLVPKRRSDGKPLTNK